MAERLTRPTDKQQPVRILMRDSAVSQSTVTVAPVSSTIRGVPSGAILDVDDGRVNSTWTP
jgi:hypothetical protein